MNRFKDSLFDESRVAITPRDRYSFLVLWEEGCLFHRILNHLDIFPDSSSVLYLAVLPYCALIEHDSIKFINSKLGGCLPYEGERINKLRNLSKSLCSKGLSFEEYTDEVNYLLGVSSRYFKNHKGSFSFLANAIQPDVGVYYYKGLPICSTYTSARYLAEKKPADIFGGEGVASAKNLGYDVGQSAAFLYCFSEKLFPGKGEFTSREFVTKSNDFHLSNLLTPLALKEVDNAAVFFLLTDLLFQINSAISLLDCGVFTRRLWIKFATVNLFHGLKSIRSFLNHSFSSDCPFNFPRETLIQCGGIFPKDISKVIIKSENLRHALVHYDFEKIPSRIISEEAHADYILIESVRETLGMTIEEYEAFLTYACSEVSGRIICLTGFPRYNKAKDPDIIMPNTDRP